MQGLKQRPALACTSTSGPRSANHLRLFTSDYSHWQVNGNTFTWCMSSANWSSIGFRSCDMTGSLWRHTAPYSFHGDATLSVLLLVWVAARQAEPREIWRTPVCFSPVRLTFVINCHIGRLAILEQGAAILILLFPPTILCEEGRDYAKEKGVEEIKINVVWNIKYLILRSFIDTYIF